ncbi:Mitochondrial oxaloacetate carrier protein [Chytridiales sp. JEL 0842]|nr:Mitochondrial oxaloacetate carrier protein [Chytridiales sp. JEL 0842]
MCSGALSDDNPRSACLPETVGAVDPNQTSSKGLPTQPSSTSLLCHSYDTSKLILIYLSSLSATAAVTFTNPWEVVKTRLQLQGELEKRNPGHKRPYGSAPQAFIKIFRDEGIRGIQKGLAPAYVYQILLNGTRLGFYEPLRDLFQETADTFAAFAQGIPGAWGHHKGASGNTGKVVSMILGGASGGVLGACFASPLYLIKTRMQSYTPSKGAAVGHQHAYVTQGWVKSLGHIFKHEGVRGLWRGVDAAMLRTGIGSAVQLSSYDGCKQTLLKSGWFDVTTKEGGIELHFAASAFTSLLVCLAMNPFDVASTRMYNQHVAADGKHGSLYNSGIDCIVKTVKAEGFGALYKGFSAHCHIQY